MAIVKELKRRNVLQTAALYVAIAWGGTEILAFLIDALWGERAADVASKYLAILFIAGFPVAMYLAWSRDLGRKARRYVGASALAVLIVAVLVWLVPSEPEAPYSPLALPDGIKALAVLPLDNLSADPDQDYFAAGMTEALIAELSELAAFKVISRTSVMRYKGTSKTLPEIANELGVDAVVEGSVLRSGDRVRVTAQLIDAATDHHLWADSFEGNMEDVLALQGDAARAMVRGIGASMDAPVMQERERKRVEPEALEAYLKVRLMRGTAEEAIQAAERVIELDPSFAPGYALLSGMYSTQALSLHVTHGDAYLRARWLAQKAVELDPELVHARIAMARVLYQFEWDWQAAEAEFERGLALDPNNADGLAMYGGFRVLIHKDCDGGLALLESARERDPFNPSIHFNLGVYNFHCRRPDDSIRHLEQAIALAPPFFYARIFISHDYVLNGQFEQAANQCDALAGEIGGRFHQMLTPICAWTYGLAGRKEEARQILGTLRNPPAGDNVDPLFIAFACMGLDDIECALDEIEISHRQRSSNMIFLRTAPALDPIRHEPRFQAIVDKMDFPNR